MVEASLAIFLACLLIFGRFPLCYSAGRVLTNGNHEGNCIVRVFILEMAVEGIWFSGLMEILQLQSSDNRISRGLLFRKADEQRSNQFRQ